MKPIITFPDLEKLDIRVGTIVSATLPEWSEKLIQLEVDFGSEIGKKTIFSGVKAFFTPEELQGKQSLFLVNLAPRKMGPAMSEGMIMMADDDTPVLLSPFRPVADGSVVR